MNKKIYIGVYGIIINDGRILLIKKARGPYKGMYDLPGGGIEYGESFEKTLEREFLEETGLKVRSLKFIQNNQFTAEYKNSKGEEHGLHHIGVYYSVESEAGSNIKTDADGEDSLGAEYIDINKLPDIEISPIARPVVERFLKYI
ncbi:MAG: NUDIX domain-containing protein [Patescibacteria group bacterium]|mgnify:CR=1 FL=1